MMDLFEKSMHTLELPKVLDLLASQAVTEEGKRLIKESGDVVFMYRGHVHIHSVNDMGEECGNVKMIDIGGYGYAVASEDAR